MSLKADLDLSRSRSRVLSEKLSWRLSERESWRVGESGVEGFFGFFWVVVLDLGWGLDSVRRECDR